MTTIPVPQCVGCKRFDPRTWACEAFKPEPIPADILDGRHDHREPHEGDGGKTFDPVERTRTFDQKRHPEGDSRGGQFAPEGGGGPADGGSEAGDGLSTAANAIHEARDRYPSLLSGLSLDQVRVGTADEMSPGEMAFLQGGEILLHPDITDPEKMAAFHEEWKGLFVATSGDPEETARAVVLHEIGHAVERFIRGNMNRSAYEPMRPMLDAAQGGDAPVSFYAQESDSEAFAEMFAASILGVAGRSELGTKVIDGFVGILEDAEERRSNA